MTAYGYIYKTTNLVNGNIYIGQHEGVFTPKYLGSGLILNLAIKIYGKESFAVIPLCHVANKTAMDELEKFFISHYRKTLKSSKLYNISQGGTGGRVWTTPPGLGRYPSLETRKKLSEAHKGAKHWLYKKGHLISGKLNPHFGRKHSEKTKAVLSAQRTGKSNWSKGIPKSAEVRKKISETKKARYASGQIKHWNKGRHWGEDVKIKMRHSHKKSGD
jgi:group I intron endonuclease